MEKGDTNNLLKQASEMHNSLPYEDRIKHCITSCSTQIRNLQIMKRQIQNEAKQKCAALGKRIKETTRELEKLLREWENFEK